MHNVTLNVSLVFAIASIAGCSAGPSHGASSIASEVAASPATSAQGCQSLGVTTIPKIIPTLAKTFDVNRDGIPDVVVGSADGTDGVTLAVMLGLAGGGYGSLSFVDFGADDVMEDFDIRDVSGDGIPDIVVAKGYDYNTVAVVFGHGDGTFAAPLTLTIDPAGGAISVRIADFNNDGHPDFIAENSNEPTVAVFLGNGQGGFSAPVLSAFGGTSSGEDTINAVDLNRDGVLDIVVANGYSLGRGDGSFQAPRLLPNDPLFTSDVVGDFNGDGIPDIVGSFESVELFLGKGDGTFAPGQAVRSPAPSGIGHALLAADVDRDGNTDLVIAPQSGGNSTILFGAGDAGFPRSQTFSQGYFGASAANDGAGTSVILLGDALNTLRCGP
jgi:FG-GAP-like repeat